MSRLFEKSENPEIIKVKDLAGNEATPQDGSWCHWALSTRWWKASSTEGNGVKEIKYVP